MPFEIDVDLIKNDDVLIEENASNELVITHRPTGNTITIDDDIILSNAIDDPSTIEADTLAGNNGTDGQVLTSTGTDANWSSGLNVPDDTKVSFGTDDDFEWIYNSSNDQVQLVNNNTGNVVISIDVSDDILDVRDDANFPGITGSPSFSGHDHSEGGMTSIPNSGLSNSTFAVSVGNFVDSGLSGGGTASLGGTLSISFDPRDVDASSFDGSDGSDGQILTSTGSDANWESPSGSLNTSSRTGTLSDSSTSTFSFSGNIHGVGGNSSESGVGIGLGPGGVGMADIGVRGVSNSNIQVNNGGFTTHSFTIRVLYT